MPGVKADGLENLLLPSTGSGLLDGFIGASVSLYVNWVMLHIFLCSQICMPVCMHMWKPEVDVWCLSLLFSTLLFETGSITEHTAHRFTYTSFWEDLKDLSLSTWPALGFEV